MFTEIVFYTVTYIWIGSKTKPTKLLKQLIQLHIYLISWTEVSNDTCINVS